MVSARFRCAAAHPRAGHHGDWERGLDMQAMSVENYRTLSSCLRSIHPSPLQHDRRGKDARRDSACI
jgi:hypothetical protein